MDTVLLWLARLSGVVPLAQRLSWLCLVSHSIAVSDASKRLLDSGCGIKCVIAESYAFIYSRNSPSLGLTSVVITDSGFYKVAQDGVDINVKIDEGKIQVGGKQFTFEFSVVERRLMDLGGIAQAFNEHGKSVFEALSAPSGTRIFSASSAKQSALVGHEKEKAELQW